MQFYLETEELNLLADVLLEQDLQKYGELLNKVMSRDLRFDADEFLQAADLLADKKSRLTDEIARQTNVALKGQLLQKLVLVERVLDKVNECCVMF